MHDPFVIYNKQSEIPAKFKIEPTCLDRSHLDDPGIVDQDVQSAEHGDGRLNQPQRVSFFADVS